MSFLDFGSIGRRNFEKVIAEVAHWTATIAGQTNADQTFGACFGEGLENVR